MAGTLAALCAVAVGVYVAVEDSGPDMDRTSYKKGYHAFGDAWLPPSDEERAADEARCEELWGQFPPEEIAGLNKDDWVAGCADYIEGKDSRF
jgi:hypothetical protein